MKEQMLDSEYYVCPECGKIFRFYPSTIYVKNTGKKRIYYCSYNCWRKNGGGNKRHYVAGYTDKKAKQDDSTRRTRNE